jgi:hypothetical protein
MKPGQIYVEYSTGDYYEVTDHRWQKQGNIGLHWAKAIGEHADQVKKS